MDRHNSAVLPRGAASMVIAVLAAAWALAWAAGASAQGIVETNIGGSLLDPPAQGAQAGQEGAAGQGFAPSGQGAGAEGQGAAAPGQGAPADPQAIVNPSQAPTPSVTPVRLTTAPQPEAPGLPGLLPPGISLMKFIGAFIVVLALLLICLRLIGWLSRGSRLSKGGRVFNLRGTMALDAKRYLAAVEVDGHLLVVGVAPDRLTSLADWPIDDDFYDGPTLAPVEPKKREARESFPRAVAPKPLAKPPAPKDEAEEGPSFLEKKSPAASAEPKEAPKRGRDGPDFTLSLEDEPFEGSTTNDDFKLDLDRE